MFSLLLLLRNQHFKSVDFNLASGIVHSTKDNRRHGTLPEVECTPRICTSIFAPFGVQWHRVHALTGWRRQSSLEGSLGFYFIPTLLSMFLESGNSQRPLRQNCLRTKTSIIAERKIIIFLAQWRMKNTCRCLRHSYKHFFLLQNAKSAGLECWIVGGGLAREIL